MIDDISPTEYTPKFSAMLRVCTLQVCPQNCATGSFGGVSSNSESKVINLPSVLEECYRPVFIPYHW